jgi:hypothetical protein
LVKFPLRAAKASSCVRNRVNFRLSILFVSI